MSAADVNAWVRAAVDNGRPFTSSEVHRLWLQGVKRITYGALDTSTAEAQGMRPYRTGLSDGSSAFVLPAALGEVFGLRRRVVIPAAPEPAQRTPSAWTQRAEKVLERDGVDGLRALCQRLEDERATVRALPPRDWPTYGGQVLIRGGMAAAEHALTSARAEVMAVLRAQVAAERLREQQAARYRAEAERARQEGAERLPDGWEYMVRAQDIADTLSALGGRPVGKGYSCPSCNAETRGKQDRRPAVWIERTRTAAKCWACDWNGNKASDAIGWTRHVLRCSHPDAGRFLLGVNR